LFKGKKKKKKKKKTIETTGKKKWKIGAFIELNYYVIFFIYSACICLKTYIIESSYILLKTFLFVFSSKFYDFVIHNIQVYLFYQNLKKVVLQGFDLPTFVNRKYIKF